ncbi:MAG: hypothetical protein ABIQ44_12160 [Chloroflexia bacterium]
MTPLDAATELISDAVKLTYAEKRAILEALHVTATATADGDVLVRAQVTEDLLRLLVQSGPQQEGASEPASQVLSKASHAMLINPPRSPNLYHTPTRLPV